MTEQKGLPVPILGRDWTPSVARFIGFLLVWFIVCAVVGVVRNKLFPPTNGQFVAAFNLDWRNLPGFIFGFLVGVQSLRKGWPWLAWTLAVIAFAFCCVGWKMAEGHAYSVEHQRIAKMILSIKDRKPATVSKKVWNNGIGWALTAHCNICFCPGPGHLEAMSRFGEELDDKLQGEIDLSVYDWIWDRLGEIEPGGKDYTNKFRSSLKEHLQPGTNMQWLVPD